MSLINDALKQAQKSQPTGPVPPAVPPARVRPLPPASAPPREGSAWLVPVLVMALIVATIFIIGLAASRNTLQKVVAAAPVPEEAAVPELAPAAAPVATATVSPRPMDESIPESSVPVKNLPRLQGIFYSPTSPSAIIDGKTVRPGDNLADFHIKQINKTTVILVGKNGKQVQLTMN